MLPVWRQIQQVVQQVNAGCAQAEGKEGERRVYYGFWFEQTVRGKQWNQYQKVLQPLVQPQGLDPGAEPPGCPGRWSINRVCARAWFASDPVALTTTAPAACFQTGRSTRWLPR